MSRTTLTLEPIGVLHSPHVERAQAPRQPRAALGIEGTIELDPGRGFEDALADLEGWQYVWVIAWFDRNTTWKPKVTPPRSTVKRGVFSTRAPHRPNPIALSVFELIGVEGLTVKVRNVDLLDHGPAGLRGRAHEPEHPDETQDPAPDLQRRAGRLALPGRPGRGSRPPPCPRP